jgi:hypothetical protein
MTIRSTRDKLQVCREADGTVVVVLTFADAAAANAFANASNGKLL